MLAFDRTEAVRRCRALDVVFAAIRELTAHSGIGFGPVKELHAVRAMPHTSELIAAFNRIERIPPRANLLSKL